MNKIIAFSILSVFILCTSCEKEGLSRIGFETSVNESSSGTTTMTVSEESGTLTLSGTVILTGGKLLLELTGPDDNKVWTNTFEGPVEASVDESFNAKKGSWTLKYTSISGSGNIDVHLTR